MKMKPLYLLACEAYKFYITKIITPNQGWILLPKSEMKVEIPSILSGTWEGDALGALFLAYMKIHQTVLVQRIVVNTSISSSNNRDNISAWRYYVNKLPSYYTNDLHLIAHIIGETENSGNCTSWDKTQVAGSYRKYHDRSVEFIKLLIQCEGDMELLLKEITKN